jgi:heavy metal translocating P-type ATPase
VIPCAQCGLPAPEGAAFCCYGCELCHQIQTEARDDHASLVGTMSFTVVLSMIVMMLALFLYAEDVFDVAGDVELAWLRSIYRWASWILATPVLVLAGGPLAKRALRGLERGRLSMDALIVMGAVAAYVLSVDALFRGRHALYFDSATAAIVLASFGRLLEARAKSAVCRALGPLLETARGRVRAATAGEPSNLVSAHEVEPGMRLEIEPGQVIPVDVRLDSDDAEVDLSILTGESRPIEMARGERIPAGAVPVASRVEGVALTRARDSALDRLAKLAASLEQRPSASLAWADRFAAALTPAVAVVAIATVVVWTRAGFAEKGVISALAVVLAACPCTYAIASPLVHWIMLKTAFHKHVLVRNSDVLEGLAKTRAVAFDKTGTLTRSELAVARERVAPAADRAEVLSLVRALEEGCSHPFARALSRHARGAPPAELERRRLLAGRGVEAFDEEGRRVRLHAGTRGETLLERDGTVLAEFELDEQLRPEAREAVDALKRDGLCVVLLSGDDETRVARVGSALGIEAAARLSAEEKVARMEAIGPNTAMVGDGMNDAPALASCRTSFALGDAAQLPKALAQVTLLEPDLRLVPWTLALSRRAVRTVQSLLIFSTMYNLVFVGLAAAGALRPVWAGVSMLVSSLLAIGVAAVAGRDDEAHRAPIDAAAQWAP